MHRFAAVALPALFLASSAPGPMLAQAPPAASATPATGDETPAPGAPGKITEQDFTPSVYTYEVGGRRDPFRSLRCPPGSRGR